MSEIKVLDQQTINQIAAGEVIERPASVVKELVENAVDAGASAVTVEIKDGGISFIRVTDNGCGIPKDQVPVAFLRHSTSKIRSALDLMTVSSLGFRGEALSSIAAVGQVELVTRVTGALTGTRYVIWGGEEKSIEEIGAPEGTTFLVRNLFYNTPARKKFLKTAQTEAGYVSVLLERMALSRPDISFRLIVNNQTKLHSAGNHKVKDLLYQLYGREITSNLLPVTAEGELLKISGFIGKPILSRGNRNYQHYFINGRYVRSSIVSKAIEDAYQGKLMQHKYPFTVLYLTIDPNLIDVNVHPTKMELRFSDNEQVYKEVFAAVQTGFSGKELIPQVTVGKDEPTKDVLPKKETLTEQKKQDTAQSVNRPKIASITPAQIQKTVRAPEPFEYNRRVQMMVRETGGYETEAVVAPEQSKDNIRVNVAPKTTYESHKPTVNEPIQEAKKPEQLNLFEEKILTQTARMKYRFIGQLFDTYWLIQFGNEFLIMDQHAAHEKILFERMMKKLKSRQEIFSQSMNPPAIITLSAVEEDILNRHMTEFKHAGYEIEPFGGKEYALYGVPADLPKINGEEFFRELIDRLGESGVSDSTLILETIASMSCKAAVKGNHMMSLPEAEKLVDELMTLENPYSCPHGRPTIIRISKAELEKKFNRIV
ncbi:MAG: DNA mismatch repair endonuclease MutL [Lachnospiraceae bacterium]|nr:DNA mismatch repair endonuclease MutL [Lachnospiraceae bacterium]